MDTPPDVNERIAERVRELRAKTGLSLDALASRSGVSRSMISLVERAESSPTAVVRHARVITTASTTPPVRPNAWLANPVSSATPVSASGATLPLVDLKLPPGPHSIEVRSGRFPPLQLDVHLQPGEEMQLKHQFAAPAAPPRPRPPVREREPGNLMDQIRDRLNKLW